MKKRARVTVEEGNGVGETAVKCDGGEGNSGKGDGVVENVFCSFFLS
ncbi:hypothetical protein A2U01_0075330 [Trifolium medium]|uniref:Uncharacterized protein n=1 Tax=Trifolium medium TaxID=97028 RepID=A0A392SZ10_9FABA|nr:hypothetical protein [Trifolium medium]